MLGQKKIVNGVDVGRLGETIQTLKAEPELAGFRFEARNRWESGGLNHSEIDRFYGTGQTHEHANRFVLHADEPPVLLGGDQAPNPVQHLLHALASCMTTSMVYHAAARGISIEHIESELDGSLDVRGFMGLSDEVRKGYERIGITFRVKSDGSEADLLHCAKFSPVYDVVSRGTKVELEIIKQ